MNRCATCKHWSGNAPPDGSTEEYPDHSCGRIELVDFKELEKKPPPSPRIECWDWEATFITPPDFGCTLWEAT